MGKKRRPPHSVSAEDIDRDLAEMRHSPITRPNLSFLAPSRKTVEDLKSSPVDISGVVSVAEQSAAAPTPPVTAKAAPDVTTPTVIRENISTPVDSLYARRKSRPLHYCLTARDGHSPTEHLIYSVMWAVGRPEIADDDGPRIVQMSQPELARRVGITERNLRIAIVRLIEKLALEEVSDYTRDTKAPRVYRVFSENEILRRRREAGLLWVVRRKGVQFVAVSEGELAEAHTTPVVIAPIITTGVDLASVSPYPSSIRSAFRQHGLTITPAVAARLWLECRRRLPDCTPEELEGLLNSLLTEIRALHPVEEILEQLLVKWPEFVEPARLARLREVRNLSLAKLRRIDEDNRLYWQSLAADPAAKEADREFARKILETL